MGNLNKEQIEQIAKDAEDNNGKCSCCNQTIKIYKYGVSRVMGKVLKRMAAYTLDYDERNVDVEKLGLKHSERTQLTKMRFHGLVAKVKVDGVQKPRHWIVTHKGWNFYKGEPIPAKAVVFDNTLLGHEGGTITIERAMGEVTHDEKPVSTEEAGVYGKAREGKKSFKVLAEYVKSTPFNDELQKGNTYLLEIDRLQMGKPVQILKPIERRYKDVAEFSEHWKVLKQLNGKEEKSE